MTGQWLVLVQEPPSFYVVGVYGPFPDRPKAQAAARAVEDRSSSKLTAMAIPLLPEHDLATV